MFKSTSWSKSLLFLLALLLGMFAVACSSSTSSSDKSVVVSRRDGDITILPNGDVRVVETWATQFIGGPFHTAFRSIPVDRVEAITDWGVTEPGITYGDTSGYDLSMGYVNNEERATWTFPPISNQMRTYQLSYTLHGALRVYANGDQFWWKFIEAGRSYPIKASRVVLHLPANIPVDQLKATTYLGVIDMGKAQIVDGQTIMFDGGSFDPGNQWEVRAQFPHGIVSASVPVWQARAEIDDRLATFFNLVGLIQLFGAVILFLVGTTSAYVLWYTRLRVRPVGVVAEYLSEPPDSLSPAAANRLLVGDTDTRDYIATLVDLARRGFVKMTAKDDDYVFERLGHTDAKALRPYEGKLLDIFFDDQSSRHLFTLPHRIWSKLARMYADIVYELVQAGYISKKTIKPGAPLARIGTLIFWGVGIPAAAAWYFTQNTTLGILDVAVVLIVSFIFGNLGNTTIIKTPQGETATAKWKAFKHYLEHIEKYTKLESAQAQFDKYLPYAIAFGVEKGWVTKFAQVGTPAPTWYWDNSDSDRRQRDDDRHGRATSHTRVVSDATLPSLDQMTIRSFASLDSMSHSLFDMLNSASEHMSEPSSSSSGSSSSSSSSSSFSGGSSSGGGGGGGGSSGFG